MVEEIEGLGIICSIEMVIDVMRNPCSTAGMIIDQGFVDLILA